MENGEQRQVIDAKGRKRGLKQWVVCPMCDGGRWIRTDFVNKDTFTGMCIQCHNKFKTSKRENHGRWIGGVIDSGKYYRFVKLKEDDLFYPMAKHHGYISQHRLVMAQSLNRCLKSWEVVHHINGNKKDNRLENLQLTTPDKHIANHRLLMTINKQKREIQKLKDIINHQP